MFSTRPAGDFRETARPGLGQDYLAMLAIFLPLKMRFAQWPMAVSGARPIGYIATMLLAISVALAAFLFCSATGWRRLQTLSGDATPHSRF